MSIARAISAQIEIVVAQDAPVLFASDSWELKVSLALLTGVLGFATAYAIERIRAKKNQKRLIWDAIVDRGLVEARGDLKHDIEIRYKGESVKNLASVSLRVRNAGATVVKGQQLRVAFPTGSRILDAYLEPPPPREVHARRAIEREVDRSEACFEIGHLERAQEVRMELFTTGSQSTQMTVYPFNEEGDVDFQEGSTSRIREDREKLGPFVTLLLLAILLPTAVDSFIPGLAGGMFAGVIQFFILGMLITTVPATVRFLSVFLSKFGEPTVSGARAVFLGEVKVDGNINIDGELPKSGSNSNLGSK